jgi:hypothetical protein
MRLGCARRSVVRRLFGGCGAAALLLWGALGLRDCEAAAQGAAWPGPRLCRTGLDVYCLSLRLFWSLQLQESGSLIGLGSMLQLCHVAFELQYSLQHRPALIHPDTRMRLIQHPQLAPPAQPRSNLLSMMKRHTCILPAIPQQHR